MHGDSDTAARTGHPRAAMRLVRFREKAERDTHIPRGMGKSKHLGGNINKRTASVAHGGLTELKQQLPEKERKGAAERWMEVLQAADLPNIQAAVCFVFSIPSSTGFVERISSFMKNKWTDVPKQRFILIVGCVVVIYCCTLGDHIMSSSDYLLLGLIYFKLPQSRAMQRHMCVAVEIMKIKDGDPTVCNRVSQLAEIRESGETSKVKVSDEGGEEPRKNEERIAMDQGEEKERESVNDEPGGNRKEGKEMATRQKRKRDLLVLVTNASAGLLKAETTQKPKDTETQAAQLPQCSEGHRQKH
ncbi:hypothetical protein D9C73_006038 [Collichthys lucidus]|uniref:Uncharacterized protein n=1 Tax=Collichthys lucidus TaxID=240159 RepID=A0A4U5UF75_COLLU|nr:hypothetical protein D9C73_006038 [Collichthys lucidus]